MVARKHVWFSKSFLGNSGTHAQLLQLITTGQLCKFYFCPLSFIYNSLVATLLFLEMRHIIKEQVLSHMKCFFIPQFNPSMI